MGKSATFRLRFCQNGDSWFEHDSNSSLGIVAHLMFRQTHIIHIFYAAKEHRCRHSLRFVGKSAKGLSWFSTCHIGLCPIFRSDWPFSVFFSWIHRDWTFATFVVIHMLDPLRIHRDICGFLWNTLDLPSTFMGIYSIRDIWGFLIPHWLYQIYPMIFTPWLVWKTSTRPYWYATLGRQRSISAMGHHPTFGRKPQHFSKPGHQDLRKI